MPSGPYALRMLRAAKAEATSSVVMVISGINSVGEEGSGETAPESFKFELDAKVLAKSSALAEGRTTEVPSGILSGGKEGEEKLELIFLKRCQNAQEEEER